ncbi:MAG: hypothetical protein LBJ33_06690 [Pseudomonas putida]|nr:hypothetical protein [Pseudomonas putida]
MALGLVLAGAARGIEGTIPVGVVTVTAWMLLWRSAEKFFLDLRNINRQQRKYQRIKADLCLSSGEKLARIANLLEAPFN